jgi:hypothetical protein
MCVCVFARARGCLCCCLKGEQPPSASVYGQGTSTRHPRAESGNIKASGCAALWAHQRLQGRFKSACTSPPCQSQYLWITHDASRIRLQERSRTCEAVDARAFAVQQQISCLCRHEHPRKTAIEAVNQEKTLTVRKVLFRRDCVPLAVHG